MMKRDHAPTAMEPRGILLRRREALAAVALLPLGCARPAAMTGTSSAACILSPENVEGPFYLEDAHVRADIRDGRPGLPLVIEATLLDTTTCKPLAGAALDLWHCDATGAYSGFVEDPMRSRGPGGPGGPGGPPGPPGQGAPGGPPPFGPGHPPPFGPGHPPPRPHPTDGARFLRGVQLSDASGRVRFTTIYPGWYAGRAVHIHLRVRTGGAARGDTYEGGHVAHTGQLFLPESTSDAVFAQGAYAAHAGRRTSQNEDGIFAQNQGSGMLVLAGGERDGFVATTILGVDPTATPAARM